MSHAETMNTLDPRARRNSLMAGWRDHPRALLIAAAIGVLIGAGVLFLLRNLADTGDEPPIRVKNGSLELQLLAKGATWTQTGSHWKTSGTRIHDLLKLTVATRGKASCTAYTVSANQLVLHYADPAGNEVMKVEIQSTGNHSKVTPSQPMSISSSDTTVLAYGSPGFIKSIEADGASMCTFSLASELDHLVVLDF
jgi:hypothetical protein